MLPSCTPHPVKVAGLLDKEFVKHPNAATQQGYWVVSCSYMRMTTFGGTPLNEKHLAEQLTVWGATAAGRARMAYSAASAT